MADVLSLLRDYHLNGKHIVESPSELVFGDFAWPKCTKTNFLAAGLPVVRLPDRRDLLAYLKGEVNTAPNIDRAAPVDISLRRPVAKRHLSDLHSLVRREATDHAVSDGFASDADTKRARLIFSSSEMLDRNLSNYDSQYHIKSMGFDEDSIMREKRVNGILQSDETKTSTLSEAVPLDKIQTWRDKFRAIQQQRTKPTDSEQDLELPSTYSGQENDSNFSNLNSAIDTRDTRIGLHGVVSDGEPQSMIKIDESINVQPFSGSSLLRASLITDRVPVQTILARERRWRTRVSILQSQGKTFYENIVLGILRNVISKEDSHASCDDKNASKLGYVPQQQQSMFPQPLAVGTYYPKPASGTSNCSLPGSAMILSTGQPGMSVTNSVAPRNGKMHYSRYDQERFAGGREDTAGFRIDTMGTYHGKALASMVTVGASKSNVHAGSATPRLSENSSRLTGVETPNIPYEPQTPRDPRSINMAIPLTPNATPDPYRSLRSTTDARLAARSKIRASRIPIIIIPAAPTSLITMYNARDILQDFRFIKPEEKQASGMRRENEILIHRPKADGRTVPYRVIDQPTKLVMEEWNRVVAVFVQGQAWQFKGWPISSDPALVFSQIKGFHLKYTNMPLDSNVAKWNVRVIELDQRRHLDKANFQQIWDQMDKHIARYKPFLKS